MTELEATRAEIARLRSEKTALEDRANATWQEAAQLRTAGTVSAEVAAAAQHALAGQYREQISKTHHLIARAEDQYQELIRECAARREAVQERVTYLAEQQEKYALYEQIDALYAQIAQLGAGDPDVREGLRFGRGPVRVYLDNVQHARRVLETSQQRLVEIGD